MDASICWACYSMNASNFRSVAKNICKQTTFCKKDQWRSGIASDWLSQGTRFASHLAVVHKLIPLLFRSDTGNFRCATCFFWCATGPEISGIADKYTRLTQRKHFPLHRPFGPASHGLDTGIYHSAFSQCMYQPLVYKNVYLKWLVRA